MRFQRRVCPTYSFILTNIFLNKDLSKTPGRFSRFVLPNLILATRESELEHKITNEEFSLYGIFETLEPSPRFLIDRSQ